MLKSYLLCGSCDRCGTDMTLMDYYNQDGVCVACFGEWMEEIENEKQEMIECTQENQL